MKRVARIARTAIRSGIAFMALFFLSLVVLGLTGGLGSVQAITGSLLPLLVAALPSAAVTGLVVAAGFRRLVVRSVVGGLAAGGSAFLSATVAVARMDMGPYTATALDHRQETVVLIVILLSVAGLVTGAVMEPSGRSRPRD